MQGITGSEPIKCNENILGTSHGSEKFLSEPIKCNENILGNL